MPDLPVKLGIVATSLLVVSLAGCAATPSRESTGEYFDDTSITTRVIADLRAHKRFERRPSQRRDVQGAGATERLREDAGPEAQGWRDRPVGQRGRQRHPDSMTQATRAQVFGRCVFGAEQTIAGHGGFMHSSERSS